MTDTTSRQTDQSASYFFLLVDGSAINKEVRVVTQDNRLQPIQALYLTHPDHLVARLVPPEQAIELLGVAAHVAHEVAGRGLLLHLQAWLEGVVP